MYIESLIITLLSGISFFIGYIISKFMGNSKKILTFAVGFAFSIILGLALTELLPECIELLENKIIMIISMLSGIIILKLLDKFIPDHDHHSKEKNHMNHIGIISFVALLLHNIIEGSAIYTTSLNDLKVGLFMALGVSFHNIPLGIQITSLINNKKEKIIYITLLVISSLIGPFILEIFNIELTNMINGILISITFGMLIYISLFELLCEVKENIKNKNLIIGILLGLVFILLGHLIH